MRGVVAVAVVVALCAACTDAKTIVDPEATALEVVVQVPGDLGVDRLQISAVGGEFAAGTVPDSPRPLAGEQSVVVLLSPDLDGTELVVRVDGLAGAQLVASGGTRATVRMKSVERVIVVLEGPVTCGDAMVDPLLELCDDGNVAAGDGCSATCGIESGFRCDNPPGLPSACRPDTFDVLAAASVGHRLLELTFSDAPDAAKALDLAVVVPNVLPPKCASAAKETGVRCHGLNGTMLRA
jgi:cysteine-rich repeat protein